MTRMTVSKTRGRYVLGRRFNFDMVFNDKGVYPFQQGINDDADEDDGSP